MLGLGLGHRAGGHLGLGEGRGDPGALGIQRRGGGHGRGDVDISLIIAGDADDFESGHDRARRVRPVGRNRDQADVPIVVATRPVVGADREEAGELPLGPGVGLQ